MTTSGDYYSISCASALLQKMPTCHPDASYGIGLERLYETVESLLPSPLASLTVADSRHIGLRDFCRRGRSSALGQAFLRRLGSSEYLALFFWLPEGRPRRKNFVLHNLTDLREYGSPCVVAEAGGLLLERRPRFIALCKQWWLRQSGAVDFWDDYDPEGETLNLYDLRRFMPGAERQEAARNLLQFLGHRPGYDRALRDLDADGLVRYVHRLRVSSDCRGPTTEERIDALIRCCRSASA